MFPHPPLLALQALATTAHTVTYDWSIDWVSIAPDGFKRPAVGINGQWPCPPIQVNIGDTVKMNLKNNLGNETTSLHFHGIFQMGSNQMDGPAMVTQCPVPPGSSFTYEFQINQPGTYWYHSHMGGQYIDGLRGPIIVHDPAAPYASEIDEEIVLTISDWYHDQAPPLIRFFQSPVNEELHGGSEPVPNATLINEARNMHFGIKPNRNYLFRIINMGAFAAQYLEFDQHDVDVVEIDGVYTQSHRVSQLYLPVAQRYSVILKSKSTTNQNFAIVASMDLDMFDPGVTPPNIPNNSTSWLVYDEKKPLPAAPIISYDDKAQDDSKFIPYDNQAPLGPVTNHIELNVAFGPGGPNNNINRATFNNITFVPQMVPTLYTALSAPPALVNNPLIYGKNVNPYVLSLGAIVDITVVNYDSGAHPFHLHGHNFQLIYRSGPGPDDGPPILPPKNYSSKAPAAPMRRDTVMIQEGGSAVFRFKVDNPGITLFHCHIEWHVEAGLSMVFIEAPTELQKLNLQIPQNHKDACKEMGIPMTGNAAGNTNNWLDLTGAPTEPTEIDTGALYTPPARKLRSRLNIWWEALHV